MDEIHQLHWYGKYSYSDVLEMTARERIALGQRTMAALKAEADAVDPNRRSR